MVATMLMLQGTTMPMLVMRMPMERRPCPAWKQQEVVVVETSDCIINDLPQYRSTRKLQFDVSSVNV
jgi:hypothetical protein